ncbi:glycosyltransferase family 2 protein [Rubellimicrobium sp. CFH 75288]|uniref:glycosyltransferase family 2 protein n=1 Tax=Rubellimicrobium sp. CFH 75288 TaxID=2697034 RepID=UPI0014136F74|nr:glycosyltransferase family 2 protein [Rubellimicrobium sp. CFH 75288]NAZ37376.1 glycosyltransferase family 2 protein [Rubellimicrobium sp. CFH 75288]
MSLCPVQPPGAERLLVFAAMRNEGAFAVEWLCWQRMLGFHALIALNDCTDRSPDLLGAFERAGWCTLVAHSPRPGQTAKQSAFRAIRGHPLLRWADWLWVCDADEFLVPLEAEDASGLLDRLGRDAEGWAIHWRCFGDGGQARWSDRPVHRTFLRAAPRAKGINVFVKTLLRDPLRWRRLTDHTPIGAAGAAEDIRDTEGRRLARLAGPDRPVRFCEAITHRHAQVNHYVIRWTDSFDLKRGTPSATAGIDRYTAGFFRSHNDNSEEDRSALRFAARFDALHAEAMALPGVRRLHHLCCMDYAARLAARAGLLPEQDPRWRHHRSEALRP